MTGATPETPAQRLARVQGATAPVAAQVFGSGADLVNAGRQGLASGAALAPAPTVPSHQPIPVTIPGVGNITPALQSFDEKGRGLLQGFTQTVGALTPHDILPAPPQRLGMVRGPEGMAPAGYQPPATIGTAVPKTYAGPLAPTPSIANAITSGPSSPTAEFVGRQIPALAAFEAAGPIGEAAGKLLPVADEALPFLQQAVPRVAGLTAQGGLAGAISDPDNPLRGFRQGAMAAGALGSAGEVAVPALGAVGRGAGALLDRAPAAIQSGVDALGRLVPPALANEQGSLFGATTPGRLLMGGAGGTAIGAGIGALTGPADDKQRAILNDAALGGLTGVTGVSLAELADRRGALFRDPLTGAGNAHAYAEALPRTEANPNTAIVSGDLINLKPRNDLPANPGATASHAVGDAYIVHNVTAARQAVQDVLGVPAAEAQRMVFRPHAKGDELSILDVPKDQAPAVAARWKELAGTPEHAGWPGGVTVGVGGTAAEAETSLAQARAQETVARYRPQAPLPPPPQAPPPDVPPARGPNLNNESGRIGLFHGSPHKLPPVRMIEDAEGNRLVQGMDEPVPAGAKVVAEYPQGRFDMSKVGTGEGAQSYGHGLYFAGDKSVATYYRDSLAPRPEIQEIKLGNRRVGQRNHFDYNPRTDDNVENVRSSLFEDLLMDENGIAGAQSQGKFQQHVLKALDERIAGYRQEWPEGVAAAEKLRQELSKPGAVSLKVKGGGGALYQVEHSGEPDHFLDWDKPLSQQSAYVQEALHDAADKGERTGDDVVAELLNDATDKSHPNYGDASTGQHIYEILSDKLGGSDKASEYLRQRGIAGNKYLDAGSRGKGTGSHNYVVFDDNALNIMGREGKGALPILGGLAGTGLGAAAGYTQGTTPEERRRNAILGGLGGALAGGYGGHLLERPGEASIPPGEPSTPVTGNPAPLAAPGTLPAPVEGVQGPLRRPEQTALAQLGNAAPDVVAAQANLGRQIPGPRPQTLERFGKEAAEVAETTDPRVLAQLDPQRMTRAERGALSIHSAGRTEQALALDRQLNDPALPPEQRAALEAQRAQAVAEALQFHRAASTAATEAARDLVSRKAVFDQAHSVGVWQDVAEQTAGRPLTDGEAARLRQFYGAKDARGALGYIATLRPSSVGDKALTTWKAGLLTGGAIPVKATSDLTWGVMRDLSRVPGGMADYLLGLATRERTTAAQVNFGARVRGAAAHAGDFGAALKGLPTTEELAAGHVPLQTNFGSPILTAALNGPFRILKGISEVAAKGAMQASIENQATALTVGLKGAERAAARARLILQPTAEMQVRAVQDALYDTMTDKTALGSALKGIQSIPGAGQVIMPFTRTPGSIATKVIAETGPVALVRGGYEAAQTVRQAFRDIATTGKASEATVARQALASKLLGQGVVGTAPILAGYLLYQNGRASGLAANMSPGQRQLRRSAAIPNDAFLIDGHWVAPDRLGIPGMLMSLGASLGQSQEMAQNKGLGAAAAFAGSAGRVVSDQPFVLGINRVLSTLQNPVGMGQRYIQDLATSTIPAVVRNAARSADRVERAPSTLGQAMASDLPGLRSGVPMQRDALGHGIPIVPQGLQQFGSPVKVSPNTLPTDPVMRELVRLGVTASAPKRQPDESDADYTARQIATGQRVEAAITSLLNQPAYWAAEGGAQAAMLRRAISRVQSTDSRAVRPVETPQQRLDRVTGRLPSPTLPMYTESP